MALIGEMKYLQIGGNTYEIPTSELPIASSSTLGGIKVGTNLSIDSSTGVLSANFTETDPVFSASAAAGITATDITNWNNKVSDDHKWNDVTLNKSASSGYSGYVPFLASTSETTANLRAMSDSPSSGRIAVYNSGNYLISTTPGASDSSTKVATTAWVAGKGYLTSYTETDPTVPSWAKASTKPSYTASEVGAVATSAVGAASGVAPLNASSKIDSTYLPSYVDDIIEGYYYNSKFWEEAAHTTEITGEAGKIYVDLSTNKTYRYSGTGYVEVSSGSLVTITRNLTSGTKSATINVDGTDYDIYSTDDTKNTAGSTDDTTNSLYIIGATSQGANPQTYSNKNFHIRGSYLYLGYNGTTTVTGLCFYYGSYYATMVYGGAVTGDTYTPILKFSSATPANGVILRNIANPRNDEDAVNRGYLISALSNKVSDYSLKTEDNYKYVIDLENYSGGFNINSTVYPDEEGTAVNATRWLNARFYDGALAIKAVDFTENNTSFNGYLAINKDEVNLGKINNNVVTSYIKIDNNGTTIKNVVTPTANTDAANKQYVDNKFSNITFPVTSVNGNTGAVTLDVDKWNSVSLENQVGLNTGDTTYVVTLGTATSLGSVASKYPVTRIPTAHYIPKYDNNAYLLSTTPSANDNSTRVATTAFVASAISGISVPTASSTTPAMDGTANVGSETTFARGDHVHPTDTSRAASTSVTTQATIDNTGLITYKNSGNTSLYTVQLPLFDGGSGTSDLPFLPLAGGSLTGNLSVGGTTTSTGLLTANGGISTTTLTTSGNTTVGGTLSVSGATILGSTLGVTGATILNNTLNVTGMATVGGALDVDGSATFDSGVTISGVLDVTPRRCEATLSSPGWYRVMKLTGSNIYESDGAGGFIVDFNIVRNVDTANNEAHKISLMATWSNIKFINEQSVSNTLGITKIRTTNSGSNLYVDIYYGLSTQNTVTVAFDVTCRGGDEGKFNSQPLTSVGPSPSGETVLTEYTFATITGMRVVNAESSTSFGDAIATIQNIIGDNNITYGGNAANNLHAGISGFSSGVVSVSSEGGPIFFATLGKYSATYYAAELFTYNYPWRLRIRNFNGTYHAELYYPNY